MPVILTYSTVRLNKCGPTSLQNHSRASNFAFCVLFLWTARSTILTLLIFVLRLHHAWLLLLLLSHLILRTTLRWRPGLFDPPLHRGGVLGQIPLVLMYQFLILSLLVGVWRGRKNYSLLLSLLYLLLMVRLPLQRGLLAIYHKSINISISNVKSAINNWLYIASTPSSPSAPYHRRRGMTGRVDPYTR